MQAEQALEAPVSLALDEMEESPHVFDDDIEMKAADAPGDATEEEEEDEEGGRRASASSEDVDKEEDVQDEVPPPEQMETPDSPSADEPTEQQSPAAARPPDEADADADDHGDGDAKDKDAEHDDATNDNMGSEEEPDLYEKLRTTPSSLPGLVTDWLARVPIEGPAAVADILSFVLRLARPVEAAPRHLVTSRMVIANDPVATLEDIAHVLRVDVAAPVAAVAKDPVSRKLRRAYGDFWRGLAAEASHVVLFDTDCFDTLISWLEAMAAASSRALRTAACIAAYRLVDGFVHFGTNLRSQLARMQKMLATEKKRSGVGGQSDRGRGRRRGRGKGRGRGSASGGRAAPLSEKAKDLAKKVDELNANNSELIELSDKVFRGIFVLKYRDVSPDIRTLSVTALGSWIISYPDHFLDDVHNKYIGWLLSDKDALVRRSSLNILIRMLRKKDFFPSLELFLQRFCSRIVEMSRDKDDAVAVAAIHLLIKLAAFDLLDQESCEAVCDIATDELHVDIRRAAGEFLASLICAEQGSVEVEVAKTKGRDLDECAKNGKSTKAHVNSGLAPIPSLQRSCEDIKELLYVISRNNGLSSQTELAVDAVWNFLPALRCWEAFSTILAETTSTEEGSEILKVPSGGKDAGDATANEDVLSDEDKAIVCEILLVAVREASGNGDTARRATVSRGERDSLETPRTLLSRKFLPELPQLLVQFQADLRALSALVQLPRHFDFTCLEQEGQEGNFGLILEKLLDIISRHTGSPELVKACAGTFKILLSDDNPLKKVTSTFLQRGCASATKDLGLQVRSGLINAEPLSVAAAILRVRVMSELVDPNSAVFPSTLKLLQFQVDNSPKSRFSDEVTTDAARTGCALIVWSLSKTRSRMESSKSEDMADAELVRDEIKTLQEQGSTVMKLLCNICGSDNFSIATRVVCVQALLTSLTLCRGVEKLAMAAGYTTDGLAGDGEKVKDSEALDFLGSSAEVKSLSTSVQSCIIAVVEHKLDLPDVHRKRRTPHRGKLEPLPDFTVRDCFASLMQASVQSVLAGTISHMPLFGLLLRGKKQGLSDEVPLEWSAYHLCRKYCQLRGLAEDARIRQDLAAIKHLGETVSMRESKRMLIRDLTDAIINAREPGEQTSNTARVILLGLMQYVLNADKGDSRQALIILSFAGFACVVRTSADDVKRLSPKLEEVAHLVEQDGLTDDKSEEAELFNTLYNAVQAVSRNEAPDVPKLTRPRLKESIRPAVTALRKRKRRSKDREVVHSAPEINLADVRRSGRERKRINYAQLVGMTESGSEAGSESEVENDEDALSASGNPDSGAPPTPAEMVRNLMAFSNSPRAPKPRRTTSPPESLDANAPKRASKLKPPRAKRLRSTPKRRRSLSVEKNPSDDKRSSPLERAADDGYSSKPASHEDSRSTGKAYGKAIRGGVNAPSSPRSGERDIEQNHAEGSLPQSFPESSVRSGSRSALDRGSKPGKKKQDEGSEIAAKHSSSSLGVLIQTDSKKPDASPEEAESSALTPESPSGRSNASDAKAASPELKPRRSSRRIRGSAAPMGGKNPDVKKSKRSLRKSFTGESESGEGAHVRSQTKERDLFSQENKENYKKSEDDRGTEKSSVPAVGVIRRKRQKTW